MSRILNGLAGGLAAFGSMVGEHVDSVFAEPPDPATKEVSAKPSLTTEECTMLIETMRTGDFFDADGAYVQLRDRATLEPSTARHALHALRTEEAKKDGDKDRHIISQLGEILRLARASHEKAYRVIPSVYPPIGALPKGASLPSGMMPAAWKGDPKMLLATYREKVGRIEFRDELFAVEQRMYERLMAREFSHDLWTKGFEEALLSAHFHTSMRRLRENEGAILSHWGFDEKYRDIGQKLLEEMRGVFAP